MLLQGRGAGFAVVAFPIYSLSVPLDCEAVLFTTEPAEPFVANAIVGEPIATTVLLGPEIGRELSRIAGHEPVIIEADGNDHSERGIQFQHRTRQGRLDCGAR